MQSPVLLAAMPLRYMGGHGRRNSAQNRSHCSVLQELPTSDRPGSWQREGTSIPSRGASLSKRLETEDLCQQTIQDAISAIGVATILVAAAIPVFIAATEALTEIVAVVVLDYVVAAVTVVGVLVSK